MEERNWRTIWESVFHDLERTFPDKLSKMIDWYPSGQMEITIKLNDGSRLVYDWYNNQVFEIPCANGEFNDEQLKKNFARLLHRKIYVCGITQEQLANETGISYVTINKYLRGKAMPSLANASKIARVLRCSITELTEDCRY